jgi:hypothetical protein
MKDFMDEILKGVPQDKLDQYSLFYGINIVIRNKKVEPFFSVKLILAVSILCFMVFFIHSMVKNRKI